MFDDIVIRQEETTDYESVDNLINASFKYMPHADGNENILVCNLRQSVDFIPSLSLVALFNNKIIGHIMFNKADIDNNTILTLSIVCVEPKYQKKGVGKKLILRGHEIAKKLGYIACAVVGHDDYYPRFGYKLAKNFNIKCDYDVPDINFLVVELVPNSLSNISGVLKFAQEFYDLFDEI